MNILISILGILILVILVSKFKIHVVYLTKNKNNHKIHFKVNAEMFLFGIIKIIRITFTENYLKFLFIKIHYDKMIFDKENLKLIKQISFFYTLKILNPKIEKIKVNIEIGTENAMFTAIGTSILQIIPSIFCGIINKRINIKNYYYNVKPIYNENTLSFYISTIISFKIINILKAIINVNKNLKNKNIDYFV